MGWRDLFGFTSGSGAPRDVPTVDYASMKAAAIRYKADDGEKFPTGFGTTDLLIADYWTLRARSSQLFETNLYARGIVRRLVTNEINTGLHLEAVPEESLLGFDEDALAPWSEDVEIRFHIWEKDPRLCDHREQQTFGKLQAVARMEALVAGDVLVVLLQDPRTRLPRVHLIKGSAVRTPVFVADALGKLPNGNRIVHGVELDPEGRQVAYWVAKDDEPGLGLPNLALRSERLPAYGPRTGRRQAWLLYGTDKRMDDVRGKPLLALMLQSLREIDRYRDSVQRKAVINSMVAMFVKKSEQQRGSRPMTTGAIRRGTEQTVDTAGETRKFSVSEHIPGLVLDELQPGEEPHGFQPNGTDEKFGDFELAVIQTVLWANEIPPEIGLLSFNSNYSASQAAINEFKIYLNKVRKDQGDYFCQPIYEEWLLSQVLLQKIEAAGLLDSFLDWMNREVFGSWSSADWTGHIKPAVDLSKLVTGYERMVEQGFITRDRASRELTGTKYSKNVQKLARENALLAEANKALAELERPAAKPAPPEPDDDGRDEDKREDDRDEAASSRLKLVERED